MIQNNNSIVVQQHQQLPHQRNKRKLSARSSDNDIPIANVIPNVSNNSNAVGPGRKRKASVMKITKKPEVLLQKSTSNSGGSTSTNQKNHATAAATNQNSRSTSPPTNQNQNSENLNLVNLIGSSTVKSFITPENFEKLPLQYRKALLKLLPPCDRSDSNGNKFKLSPNALNNEYFTQACVDFKERLLSGYLLPNGQSYEIGSKSGLDRLDPWKLKHFEAYFGEKLKLSVVDHGNPESSALKKSASASSAVTVIKRKKSISSESDRTGVGGTSGQENLPVPSKKRYKRGSFGGYTKRKKFNNATKVGRRRGSVQISSSAEKLQQNPHGTTINPQPRILPSAILKPKAGRPRKKPIINSDNTVLTKLQIDPALSASKFSICSSESAASFGGTGTNSGPAAAAKIPVCAGIPAEFGIIPSSSTAAVCCGTTAAAENSVPQIFSSTTTCAALPRLRINLAQKTVAFIIYGQPTASLSSSLAADEVTGRRWAPIHVITSQPQFLPYTAAASQHTPNSTQATGTTNQNSMMECSDSSTSTASVGGSSDREVDAISHDEDSNFVESQMPVKSEPSENSLVPQSSNGNNVEIFPAIPSAGRKKRRGVGRPKSVPVTRSRAAAIIARSSSDAR